MAWEETEGEQKRGLNDVTLIQLEYLYTYRYVYIYVKSNWNADRAFVLLWKLGATKSIIELAFRWLGNWNNFTVRFCTITQHKSMKLLILLVGCSVDSFLHSAVVWKSSCLGSSRCSSCINKHATCGLGFGF